MTRKIDGRFEEWMQARKRGDDFNLVRTASLVDWSPSSSARRFADSLIGYYNRSPSINFAIFH